MDFVNPWIPAAIIMFANVFGGEHNTYRYEKMTALFGWVAGISILLSFMLPLLGDNLRGYLLQIGMFSMITAVSRDYEKLFKYVFKNKSKRK